MSGPRPVRAPRGAERSCRGWLQEAALRCLMNNLDPEVAENPDELVVYGGRGLNPLIFRNATAAGHPGGRSAWPRLRALDHSASFASTQSAIHGAMTSSWKVS